MASSGVVVLSGPPCSGKSTAGRALAEVLTASGHCRIYLEVDALFELLFPESDRNRDDRLRAYAGAHLLARMFVDGGETVVLECTYARGDQRASLVEALAGSAAPLWVVEFFVTPDEAVSRFRGRPQATDLDEALVRERAEAFPYFDDALRMESSSGSPEDHVQSIVTWLRQDPRPVDQDLWARTGRGWS
ncbi:AAA family ATPase [Micromonospora sp. M51]|uniref:AAA family ATPase n=1 Tax=Micromonospora sp. M51 TaxID=2824889 RepID=UPI001B38CB00|nr:AAA family ATPase [Micromonospora sp. M51]MBQ1011091.1 AAA family ATPase [Micromonospora sp. M51]